MNMAGSCPGWTWSHMGCVIVGVSVRCCTCVGVVLGTDCSFLSTISSCLLTLSSWLHHPVFAICIRGVYRVGTPTVSSVKPHSWLLTCHVSKSNRLILESADTLRRAILILPNDTDYCWNLIWNSTFGVKLVPIKLVGKLHAHIL